MEAILQTTWGWAEQHEREMALAGLFLGVAWALVNCFLGYTILRILLVVYGVLAGVAVGVLGAVYLAGQRGQASASGMDILVACGSASALLALSSWLLYRLTLALGLAAGCALVIAGVFGSPAPLAGWVAGGLVGLAAGVAVYLFTHPLVVLFTALGGAAGAVYCGAAVVCGGEPALQAMLTGTDRQPETVAVLIGAALLLAIGGVFTQTRTAGFGHRTAPAKPKAAPAAVAAS